MKRWLAHAVGIGVLCLAGLLAHGRYLTLPMLLGDESAYVCAAEEVAQGRSPYTACPRYFYPPALARGGGFLVGLGGRVLLLGALRALVWLGAIATVWLSLGRTRWSLRTRSVVGAVLVGIAPPVTEALQLGNLSSAAAGLSIAALLVLQRRAVPAAVLLTAAILLKPLPIAVAVLLTAQGLAQLRHARASLPKPLIAGALTLIACGAVFALTGLGPEQRFYDDPPSSISVFRFLRNAGLVVPPRVLFVVALAGGSALAAWRAREPRFVAGLSLVTCLLSAPLVWNHSWLMVAPVVAVAVDLAVARYRERERVGAAQPGSQQRSRRLLDLLLVILGVCTLAASDGIGELFAEAPRANAMLLLLPLATPSLLLAYATRRPATVAS